VILNNGKIYIKDDNKENKADMQSNKMFQEINNLIVSSVQGKINDSKSFTYKILENEEFYLVKLTPLSKNIKELFAEIEVYFDKKDLLVARVNMKEISGDNTLIIFVNKKINAEIPDEKFSVK
jgi:outer membrane lipoprotein-sorting protein